MKDLCNLLVKSKSIFQIRLITIEKIRNSFVILKSRKFKLIPNIIEITPDYIINATKDINNEIKARHLEINSQSNPSEYLEYSSGWHYLIFKCIDKYKCGKALDIGAMYGTSSIYMSKRGFSVTALDGYEDNIPDAIKRKYNIKFIYANLENNKPPQLLEHYYDLVIMSEVLEHLNYNPIPALLLIRKSMKRNSTMIITTPDNNSYPPVPNSPVARTCHFLDIPVWTQNGPRQSFPHTKQYNLKEFIELLNATGFIIKKIMKFQYQGIHFIAIVKPDLSWVPNERVIKIVRSVWRDFAI